MTLGLLSVLGAAFYGATISVLALTATFARRGDLRREARRTLYVLVPGRAAATGQAADGGPATGDPSAGP